MDKAIRMKRQARPGHHDMRNCRGYIVVNIIVIMVIFAAIIGAVVYMSSSGQRQAVSSNQSANAWNLAEAGYRFLATNYLNTDDVNDNLNADDDKAAYLRTVNGRTYVIPNTGSFTLNIRPYWFYNAGTRTTRTALTVQLPGTAPAGFSMPATGRLKIGDTPGSIIRTYTKGSLNSSGLFTATLNSNTTVNTGDSVYIVLLPNADQTISPGNSLTLNRGNFTAANIPSRDGLIEIGSEARLYRYGEASVSGAVVTLTNLQHSDNSPFNRSVVRNTTNVSFKKFLVAQSRGQVGAEQRTISFNQAITDSGVSSPPIVVKLDTERDLTNNFSRSSSIRRYVVATRGTSGGGSAAFALIESLNSSCGAFWFSNTSLINTEWSNGGHLLSYDVQVKNGSGLELTNGVLGLALRAKKVTSTTEPDAYLAVTFMKYSLPTLFFNRQTGTWPFNAGDTVYGESSRNTGIIQGTPEITSGSWAGGNAIGKIRFSTVTGAFSRDEWLRRGNASGPRIARLNGNNYYAASSDNIPDGIKPRPSDFSPARHNIGPLLLVLWQKKADGAYRWLAYKDITDDDYVKGLQDWNEPDGSCTRNCDEYDGQIINDNASLYVRVQEKKVDLGSGSPVKVNDINVFYGDDSSRYTTPARPGNAIAYDIRELRRRYEIGSPFEPIWAPPYLNQWDQSVDFFSHLESGTPSGSYPAFQWDAVNPNISSAEISVLRICDDSSSQCIGAAEGTLRITELVTPDAGNYIQPEVGMLGCGNISSSSRSVGFAEFAIKPLSSGGYTRGGFLGSSISW